MNKVIWTFVFTTIALALILVFVSIFRPVPQSQVIGIDTPGTEVGVNPDFPTQNQDTFTNPDDSFFVNPITPPVSNPEPADDDSGSTTEPTAGVFVAQGCQVTGCSSTICANAGEDIVSTCEWQEEYACYQEPGTQCVQDTTGQCGWVMSEELQVCIDTKSSSDEDIQ